MFPRVLRSTVLSLGLFAAGCAALPLTAVRDAALVPPGAAAQSASLTLPQLGTDTAFSPTVFGGTTLDYAYRYGVTRGVDRAVRLGVNTLPVVNGVYAGLEEGRDLRRGTRGWGTAGYAGLIAGADEIWGALLPGHIYVQPYAGLVAGRVRGRWRPEIGLRAGLQAGEFAYAPYAALVVSAEPRLRVAFGGGAAVVGLGLDAGGLACKDCVFGPEDPVKGIYGARLLVGVAAP